MSNSEEEKKKGILPWYGSDPLSRAAMHANKVTSDSLQRFLLSLLFLFYCSPHSADRPTHHNFQGFCRIATSPTEEWKCVRITRNSGRSSKRAPKILNFNILNFSLWSTGKVNLTSFFCDFSEMKFWNKCCLPRVPVSRVWQWYDGHHLDIFGEIILLRIFNKDHITAP